MSFFDIYRTGIDQQDQRDSFFSLGKRDAESFMTQCTMDSQLLKNTDLMPKKIVKSHSNTLKRKYTKTNFASYQSEKSVTPSETFSIDS